MQYVQEPTYGSSAFYYIDGELIFAVVEGVDPTQHIQDEIYFKDEKAFHETINQIVERSKKVSFDKIVI